MNPQDPLANLHPLREPLSIGWWPLAPGWWLLAITLLLLLLVGAYLLWQRYRRNAYRRMALQQLSQIESLYEQDSDSISAASQLNALLKSTALRRYPRQDIAALSGERWRDFLNETASKNSTPLFHQDFEQLIYRAHCDAGEIDQLLTASRSWIAQHGAHT
ncbi:MAG: DUF4381 domain-containing protein [Halioglobus sp.]